MIEEAPVPHDGRTPHLVAEVELVGQGADEDADDWPGSRHCGNLDDRAGWLCQPEAGRTWSKESVMSVYRVTEIIGTSSTSWEDAAAEAIRTAAGTLRDLRVAEVVKQDIHLDEGGAITYRTKLQLSFKYEPGN
jgi:hypothetical protein